MEQVLMKKQVYIVICPSHANKSSMTWSSVGINRPTQRAPDVANVSALEGYLAKFRAIIIK